MKRVVVRAVSVWYKRQHCTRLERVHRVAAWSVWHNERWAWTVQTVRNCRKRERLVDEAVTS